MLVVRSPYPVVISCVRISQYIVEICKARPNNAARHVPHAETPRRNACSLQSPVPQVRSQSAGVLELHGCGPLHVVGEEGECLLLPPTLEQPGLGKVGR